MNISGLIQSLILLLGSIAVSDPQAAVAGKPRNLCGPESLPMGIQRRLKEEYRSWKIQELENLSPSAHSRWESEKPLRCPGLAVGRFESATTPSYAILLVPVAHPDAGYRFLVFSRSTGDAGSEARLVEKLDQSGSANYFLHTTAISKFFDKASRKKFQAQTPDGILLVDSAEKEYEVDVYFWSGGRYRHEPLDY